MTSASGQWTRAARSTSRPSPSGIRRSVTITSKASSAKVLTAVATPSASATRWLRFLSRSARVVRAEDSSSTTRIVAIALARKQDGEAGAPAGGRVNLDPAAMARHDAAGDRQPETGPPRLARVERLEHAPALVGRHAAAGVADGNGHPRRRGADGDREPPAPVHRLDAVQGDVPQHLRDLIGIKRHGGDVGLDPHVDLHSARAAGVLADQGHDVVDDLADVAAQPLGLPGPREDEEVRQDAVEPPRLLLHDAERVAALVAGERLLGAEQRRGVDDGGERVADLVGDACGELARGGEALGLRQSRLQTLALGHVGDELEQEDLAVGLAHRRAAQRESPAAGARDLEALRVGHLPPALERTVLTRLAVDAHHLIAAAVEELAELLVHPAVGVLDAEVAVDELEALAEAVDQALVEFLERRRLAPGAVEHHDDDSEGR